MYNVNYFTHSKSKGLRQIFSPEEDAYLCSLVKQFGDNCWKIIAKKMPNRTTRQCRERYKNYLSPEIKNGPWSKEEDELLKEKYKEFGPKWAKIGSFFNSRSDVNIKNRWASINAKSPTVQMPSNNIQQSILLNNTDKNVNKKSEIESISNLESAISNSLVTSSPDSPSHIHSLSDNRSKNRGDVIIIDNFKDKSNSIKKNEMDHNSIKIQNRNEINTNYDIQSPPQPISQPWPTYRQESHVNNTNRRPILNLKKHEDLLPPLTSKKHDVDNNNILDTSHPLFLETLLLADSSKNDDSNLPPSANGLVKTFPNYGGNVW